MASYTSTDLTNVQAAIVALATGSRKVSMTIGDKTTTYAQAQLPELRALRDEIQTEVAAAAGGRRFVLTQTSKGL
jgi:hypothetical protein